MAEPRAAIDTYELDLEWERVEVLAHCLTSTRRGENAGTPLLARLERLQKSVNELRESGLSAWTRLPGEHLTSLDWDLLACIVAPEVHPRVGWLFQSLQAGSGQPYPSLALLQDLLAIHGPEVVELRAALAENGRLRRGGFIRGDGADAYQSIRAEEWVLGALIGGDLTPPAPPGSLPVRLRARWNDLVLPDEQTRMLHEFLLWIKHRETVVETWGGTDTGGPIALFSGPSGTGKTFAAAVIATELGWPLYRVDVGLLVSKYVGETEKNVNRLFDAAHGREVVIQFDEADALLGKRGEVKEARDRYANMEVSHLLSRVELNRGPCVMTTNMRNQLDTAFTRRFQMIIEFPRPDAKARAALWSRLLPPRAPRADSVSTEALGEAVSLTGGQIRNAALHAAYLAAEAACPIDIRHVAVAVKREIGKNGRADVAGELGPLREYLAETE